MKELIQGLREFQSTDFVAKRDLFEKLSQGQHPRVLFITCSDSRIDPNLITQSEVGDLFVIRNAGNVVPPFGATNGGEGATIEYAINALGIRHVIICGHSHCGAMKGLLKLESLEQDMPLVYNWLKYCEATRRLIQDAYSDRKGEELIEITTAENVLTQIENLRTYPSVHSKLHQGQLAIHGWVYEIESGEVLSYDAESHSFKPLHSQLDLSPVDYSPNESPEHMLHISHNLNWRISAEQAQRIYQGTHY